MSSQTWYQPFKYPFQESHHESNESTTAGPIEKEVKNVSVLQRTIRETLIPTILFPEERSTDPLLPNLNPPVFKHPSFSKARASISRVKFNTHIFNPLSLECKQSINHDSQQNVGHSQRFQNLYVHDGKKVSHEQSTIHQNVDGSLIASSRPSTQLPIHRTWGDVDRIGALPIEELPPTGKRKKKEKAKKKRKKSKKKKKTKKVTSFDEMLSPSKSIPSNSTHVSLSNTNENVSIDQMETSKSATTNVHKSIYTERAKKRKFPSKNSVLENLSTPITSMSEKSFHGIDECDILNAAQSNESLSKLLKLLKHQNMMYVTWTIIFLDEDLSTPFLPSCQKYCTPKGPPCRNWNCTCEKQVRAMKAQKPIFGAMFVFTSYEDDHTAPVMSPHNVSIDDLSCFILPLGPALTEKNEREHLPETFQRMSDWPTIPFSCEVPLASRWDTFRKIISRKDLKCVTFNAGMNLMPYHFHRLQDHSCIPDLILPSIWDLRLAAWMLRPHANEIELELENFRQGYAHLLPKFECMKPNQSRTTMLQSILQTKENLYFMFKLYPILNQCIIKKNLDDAFDHIEGPLQSILSAMECEGVGFLPSHLTQTEPHLDKRLSELSMKARTIANDPEFMLSSPKQVSSLLFDRLKLAVPTDINATSKLTSESQHRSTSTDILKSLLANLPSKAPQHEIIGIILEFRELNKLLTTYIRPLPRLSRPMIGKRSKRRRIHPMWQQTAVRTGRLSCRKPNLQQVPGELGNIVCRSAFVPSSPDMCFFACDYSQNEVRILAHMSKDGALITLFQDKNEADIYKQMSSVITGKKLSEVTSKERSISKQVTLAILYGMGLAQVSKKLEVDKSRAQTFFNSFFARFRGVQRWINETKQFAKKNGYVCTISGRRRYLEDISSFDNAKKAQAERQAVNSVIQGSAADLMKMAMIKMGARIFDWRKGGISGGTGIPPKLLLQIHDELLFEVMNDKEDIDRLKHTIYRCCSTECERELSLVIPLKLKCSIGPDWGGLKEL